MAGHTHQPGASAASAAAAADAASRTFAFIFPMASGHINPSLPVARALVADGHAVHYLCREQMRAAIEDTGAAFHAELQELPELYDGREPFLCGATVALQREYGMEGESMMRAMMKLGEIQLEMMLPGAIRWLRKVNADLVVCCPLINAEAVNAARALAIPCVGLLTTAGPGSSEAFMNEFLKREGMTIEDLVKDRMEFTAVGECLQRMNKAYGLEWTVEDRLRPLGKNPNIIDSSLTLVTTGDFLQDPMSSELAQVYEDVGSSIVYVGPLLDKEGAKRAAGHKFTHDAEEEKHETKALSKDPLLMLKAAKAAGRKVIYASMGTVVTGDSPEWGWTGRSNVDGKPKGLSGKELCQAAWGAVFDTFGSESAEEGPLLLVALGPQDDALDNLHAPANAVCLPIMPQVDLLRAGVDLFLTHGGQNSFMEALSTGVPVVMCPGFGDQPVNARKAVSIGVGQQVERPMPELDDVATAAATYREDTAAALAEVMANPAYREEAERCSERLRAAGGVPRAKQLILELATAAATAGPRAEAVDALPRLLGHGTGDATNVDSRKPRHGAPVANIHDASLREVRV